LTLTLNNSSITIRLSNFTEFPGVPDAQGPFAFTLTYPAAS